jgi:hypothetical protein
MNTYTFESGTKSKILITFVIGVLILLLGVGINALKSSKSHDTHADSAQHDAVSHASNDEHSVNNHDENAHASDHHVKPVTVKSKLLANFYALFLFGFYIALACIFFISATTIAWGGWQVQIQKIPLAITTKYFYFLRSVICFIFIFQT